MALDPALLLLTDHGRGRDRLGQIHQEERPDLVCAGLCGAQKLERLHFVLEKVRKDHASAVHGSHRADGLDEALFVSKPIHRTDARVVAQIEVWMLSWNTEGKRGLSDILRLKVIQISGSDVLCFGSFNVPAAALVLRLLRRQTDLCDLHDHLHRSASDRERVRHVMQLCLCWNEHSVG